MTDRVVWRNLAISAGPPGFCLRPGASPARRGSWQTHGRAVCRCLKQEVSPPSADSCLTCVAKLLALTSMLSLTCQVLPDEDFNWAARYEAQLRALPLAAGAAGIAGVLLNRLAGGVSAAAACQCCKAFEQMAHSMACPRLPQPSGSEPVQCCGSGHYGPVAANRRPSGPQLPSVLDMAAEMRVSSDGSSRWLCWCCT